MGTTYSTPARSTVTAPISTRPFTWIAYGLSAGLAVVAAADTGATLFVPGAVRDPAVMNGTARGTALVALLVAPSV